jgi:hypothetical protein
VEVVSTRDGLLRALAALPPSARTQVQSEAESLLAEVEVFLADATRPGVAVPPTTGPVAPEGLDDPIDGVSPADNVAPAPSTPPAEHEPEHEDD